MARGYCWQRCLLVIGIVFAVTGAHAAAPATGASTQPDWASAGTWFDLAGNPWTVTLSESAGPEIPGVSPPPGQKHFGIAAGSARPIARPRLAVRPAGGLGCGPGILRCPPGIPRFPFTVHPAGGRVCVLCRPESVHFRHPT